MEHLKLYEDFVIKNIDFYNPKEDVFSMPQDNVIGWERFFKLHDDRKKKYLNDNKIQNI